MKVSLNKLELYFATCCAQIADNYDLLDRMKHKKGAYQQSLAEKNNKSQLKKQIQWRIFYNEMN